jgi:hypothetical protein
LYSDKLGNSNELDHIEKLWMSIVPVKLHSIFDAFDYSPFSNMDVPPLVICDFVQVLKELKTVLQPLQLRSVKSLVVLKIMYMFK